MLSTPFAAWLLELTKEVVNLTGSLVAQVNKSSIQHMGELAFLSKQHRLSTSLADMLLHLTWEANNTLGSFDDRINKSSSQHIRTLG